MLSTGPIISAIVVIATTATVGLSSAQPSAGHRSGAAKFPANAYDSITGGPRDSAPWVTNPQGELLGTDPDPYIRRELRREWSRGNYCKFASEEAKPADKAGFALDARPSRKLPSTRWLCGFPLWT